MKDFLQTADLSAEDLRCLLARAADLKRDPHRGRAILRGETVVLYFEKPSTRTRLSFETAVVRLGGHPIFASANDLHVARGESIEDTARAGSHYARAWVLRMFDHEHLLRFAHAATVPVVNALSDREHPCQSLADLFTLQERFGSLDGLRVAWIGRIDNVARSFIAGARLAGIQVRVCTPPGLRVPPGLLGPDAGVEVFERPEDAVSGVDAVYTNAWASLGDDPREAASRRDVMAPYRIDTRMMSRARDAAVFLHCMPAHRGEEVTAEVLDGPQSLVLEQAGNRLHTTGALLETLLQRELTGARRNK